MIDMILEPDAIDTMLNDLAGELRAHGSTLTREMIALCKLDVVLLKSLEDSDHADNTLTITIDDNQTAVLMACLTLGMAVITRAPAVKRIKIEDLEDGI